MSAIRIATTDGRIRWADVRLHDAPAPFRGFSHRLHTVPGGSFCRPLPTSDAVDRRRAQVAEAVARYRARKAGEA